MSDQDQALIPADIAGSLQKYDDQALAAVSTGGFLPRLQLMISNSGPCKSGAFPINHYAVIENQNNVDVGKEVDMLVIVWRPKAMDTSGDEIIVSHDETSQLFKDISAKTLEKNSGCMFGPEYLVYIPSVKKFATFFLGSKSSRREATAMNGRLGKGATLKSRHCESKGFDWYSPVCVACNQPFELPDMAEVAAQADKFNNPPVASVEVAPEEDGTEQAR